MNKASAYLDSFFLHRFVIKQGIANTWGVWGCARRSSLNNSTTVYITVGGGVQILGMSFLCNSNQFSGAKLFKGNPPQTFLVLYFHQEVIQLTTCPPDLSSAYWFSGIKSVVFWPVIMPSKRSPLYKPSMPARFIWVPVKCIT